MIDYAKYPHIKEYGTLVFDQNDWSKKDDLDFWKGYFMDLQGWSMDQVKEGKPDPKLYGIVRNRMKILYDLICKKDMFWEIRFYKIRTKKGKVIPFKPNRPQIMIEEAIKRQIIEQGLIRIALVKPRQFGGSTYISSYIYAKTKHNIGHRALIIGDKIPTSQNIFSMYAHYYANDPTRRMGDVRSNLILYYGNTNEKSNNDIENVFDISDFESTEEEEDRRRAEALMKANNDGYIRIETAGAEQAGRSFTLQWVHASEIIAWPDPYSICSSLFNCVPAEENTGIFIESTGDGEGSYFHSLWTNDLDKTYERVFVPWYMFDDYYLPLKSGDERKYFEDTLDETELRLMRDCGSTLENIKWRRSKISEQGGSVEFFAREYPETPEEAFLGNSRHPIEYFILEKSYDLSKEYDIWDAAHGRFKSKRVTVDRIKDDIVEDKFGNTQIWRFPKVGREYIVSVDPAEGLAIDAKQTKYDESVIEVFERHVPTTSEIRNGIVTGIRPPRLIQCLEFRSSTTDTTELSYIIEIIARKYNNAWCNIEANNHGQHVIPNLMDVVGYRRVMERISLEVIRELENKGHNNFGSKYTHKIKSNRVRYGWLTTPGTRPYMIDDINKYLKDNAIILFSDAFKSQVRTLTVKDKKVLAQTGQHDDVVMAVALAVQADKFIYKESDEQVENIENPDPMKLIRNGMKPITTGKDAYFFWKIGQELNCEK